MSVTELDSPHLVMSTLQAIEHDLAQRQNVFESAARDWFNAQRAVKLAYARALLQSTRASITEKKADADIAALTTTGVEHEAVYEALKAAIRVLEQRSMICMAVLKSQGRA